MMVQPAPEGQPRFITTMREHNAFCDQLVRAFGNDEFERFEPFDLVTYAIAHHDYGWDDVDANPVLNTDNGYPRGLGNGSVPGIIDTGALSACFNETMHPYSGLISSMHITGLYNARYGLSDFEVRIGGSKSIPVSDADRPKLESMLKQEEARQVRLKEKLARDPAMKQWADEARIWQNYKITQFIDTLALYFHTRHPSQHKVEKFIHVPRSRDADATVVLTPLSGGAYSLDPFPFAGDVLKAVCRGRYFEPVSTDMDSSDLAKTLRAIPGDVQVHTFVRA